MSALDGQQFGIGMYVFGGSGSHWPGCEDTHWDCKIMVLTAERDALRKALGDLVAAAHAALEVKE